ncbi:MAG: hypothetical protein IJ400_02570 [Clostridia bacterium]|nr:hypothetical protein [Clostridia bacterium]
MATKKNDVLGSKEILDIIVDKVKKSTRKRKQNKVVPIKESLAILLSTKINPNLVCDAVKGTSLGDKITYQEAILIAQIIKACNGDTQSATFIRDASGNKLKDGEGPARLHRKLEDIILEGKR